MSYTHDLDPGPETWESTQKRKAATLSDSPGTGEGGGSHETEQEKR